MWTTSCLAAPPSADAFWSFLTDLMAGRTPRLGHGLMHYRLRTLMSFDPETAAAPKACAVWPSTRISVEGPRQGWTIPARRAEPRPASRLAPAHRRVPRLSRNSSKGRPYWEVPCGAAAVRDLPGLASSGGIEGHGPGAGRGTPSRAAPKDPPPDALRQVMQSHAAALLPTCRPPDLAVRLRLRSEPAQNIVGRRAGPTPTLRRRACLLRKFGPPPRR